MAKSALASALEAFDAGDEAAALEALLVAWRSSRSTRIAAVIDRISEPLAAQDGPVKGKTVKARTEAVLALAQNPTARNVARILTTPWPGKWSEALPIVAALEALPHDPRIAMAFAKVVEATPWDTTTSRQFYWPVLHHLRVLNDRRTLPILEADLERNKSRYWDATTKPDVALTVAMLAEANPDREDGEVDDEASLAALEAKFAGEVRAEAANEKSEEELLEAIYAAPDDDGPRIVYADWLMERNNPRGELITLQLTTGGTEEEQEKRRKRVNALLKTHGAAWTGPLEDFVDEKGRVFERGFLARATLRLDQRQVPKGLDDRAWMTVHTLVVDIGAHFSGHLPAVLALPSFQHFRRIVGLYSDVVVTLPERPALEEIDIVLSASTHVEDVLAKGETLPNVRRLGLDGPLERIELALLGPLARRLEMVTVYTYNVELGPLVRLIDKLGLTNVREVRSVHHMHSLEEPWRFGMRRDAGGKLTVFHGVSHWSERGTQVASVLYQALESLQPHELTSFSIDRREPCPYDAHQIRALEKQLKRFPELASVDVPWERLGKVDASSKDIVPTYGDFHRPEKLDAAQYDTLLREVSAPPLSLTFDAYEVNGGAHQSLGDHGKVPLQKAFAKKRTWGIDAYPKDAFGRLKLSHANVGIEGLIGSDAASIDQYLAWLAKGTGELDLRGRVSYALLDEVSGAPAWRPQDHLLPSIHSFDHYAPSWVWVLAPEVDTRLPFAELEKLTTRFAWLRTMRTPSSLMLVFGATPADIPTPEQREEFDIAAFEVLWAAYEKKHGFLPHQRVAEAFAPMMKTHHYERRPLSALEEARGRVAFEYVHRSRRDTRWIYFESHFENDATVLSFHARQSENPAANLLNWSEFSRHRTFGPDKDRIRDAAEMKRVLDEATEDLTTAMRFFEGRA